MAPGVLRPLAPDPGSQEPAQLVRGVLLDPGPQPLNPKP